MMRGDPLVKAEGLEFLCIMSVEQFEQIKADTRRIAGLIKKELEKKGLELYDIKLEFGLDEDGRVMLIDEISSGNMRVYKNGKIMDPMELNKALLDE